ncbi:MAG: acetyltransferase [Candidatus Omnitrophota bacterium]
MKKNIVLLGGGGHCKACIDVIEKEDKFKIAGIVDFKEKSHQKVSGYEIIASDEDLPKLVKQYRYFLVTIGQIRGGSKRKKRFEYLKNLGAEFPVIISPLAYVSKRAFIEEGAIIMHKAFINSEANIGKNCIINTGAIIEHDTRIEDHCHISTGSVINGDCSIGGRTLVGSNAVVLNNIKIAEDTVIGAGSVVVASIGIGGGVYAGLPAKRLVRNE